MFLHFACVAHKHDSYSFTIKKNNSKNNKVFKTPLLKKRTPSVGVGTINDGYNSNTQYNIARMLL